MTATNTSLPILADRDVFEKLRALREKQPVKYTAFYSSQLGGIVTDPALMVIPFDDHMVHRGHGIFDTAGIVNGKIYDLDAHLDRFLKSAERSKLKLPGTRARDARHHRQDDRGQADARTVRSGTGSRPAPAASISRRWPAPIPASS
jgi:branched-subunit amino acid aminotransferase/4-amino-4-deoxychorismate lyase